MVQKTKPVSVQSLELRRIAGVSPQNAFSLEDLPKGLVLIYGPNGCGKSTTATAIQALLWPGAAGDSYLDLHARVLQGDDSWDIDARGRQVVALQGASDVPHPAWTAPDLRGRYHWSLQTLLEGQDGDLAAALAAEMAGGVDFQDLATSLGWAKEPSAPHKISKELRETEKQLSTVQKEQEALRKEAQQLEHLLHQRKAAADLRDRLPRLQEALELQTNQTELRELQDRIAQIPEGAKHIQSGDDTRCAALLEKIRTTREELKRISSQQDEQNAKNPLPDIDCSEDDLKAIRRSLEAFENDWRELSRTRARTAEDLAAAQSDEHRLRERLGIQDSKTATVAGYDLPEIRSWAETVFATYEADAAEAAARKSLSLDPETPLPDTASLQEFLSALRRARRTGSKAYFLDQLPGLLTLLALGGVTFFFTGGFSPAWPYLLLAVLTVFLPLWRPLRHWQLIAHCRSLLPDAMSNEEISPASLRTVIQKAEQLLEEPARREVWQQAADQFNAHQAKIDTLRDQLVASGLTPSPQKEWVRYFLEDLQAWRTATDTLAGIEAKLAEQEKRMDALLESFAATAKQAGKTLTSEDPLTDAADLKERAFEKLDQLQELRSLSQQEKDLKQRLKEAEDDLREIGQRLKLESPDPAEVKRLTELHTVWDQLFRQSEVLNKRGSDLRKKLETADPELLELEEPSLNSLKAESETAAETERDLSDQISRLEQRMESAESGRGLHDAMEDVQEKREALEREREHHAEILAGRALLDWLRESCRTQEQPELLQEANRLLSTFTNGSLQLTLDLQEGGNTFRAAQPGQPPRSLEDLSTGERTQVLMAARLAFLSKHERAPMPLLIDEALGTSDDERAAAIMQALLKVAEEGRQVFYFTAQSDEVAKWNAQLEDRSVPYTRIDLKALREQTPPQPLDVSETFTTETSDPARQSGETDREWADRLGVPAWTPHQPVEDIPLFLFLKDHEDDLTTCLKQGLRTLGPLLNLIDSNAADTLMPKDRQEHITAKATALHALAKAWRIGRPPPVDPETVAASGIVSDAFSEDVFRVLEEAKGDAQTFLAALENKAVPRWRQDNTDELRALFYEKGFLSDKVPLNEEEVISQALIDLKDDELTDNITHDDWKAIAQTCICK